MESGRAILLQPSKGRVVKLYPDPGETELNLFHTFHKEKEPKRNRYDVHSDLEGTVSKTRSMRVAAREERNGEALAFGH
jgi:hypothetical protein